MNTNPFDDHFRKTRIQCSAGSRMFFIMPNGDVYRCNAYYDSCRPRRGPLGNATHEQFQKTIIHLKDLCLPCYNSGCVSDADPFHTIQTVEVSPGNFTRYVGATIQSRNLENKNFCCLQIEITSICNFKCTYCCAKDLMDEYFRKDLDTEEWSNVINFFTGEFPDGNCVISGGEPTLHPGFEKIAFLLLQKNWSVEVFTNFTKPQRFIDLALLLTDRQKSNLHLVISCHFVEKGFDLDSIIDGCKSLEEQSIGYGLEMVLFDPNVAEAKKSLFKEKISSLNPRYVSWKRNTRGAEFYQALEIHG